MVVIEKVDPKSKSQVRRFTRIPFRIFEGVPQWVPPLNIDSEAFLNQDKHPFYEHSEAEFFIAVKDGQDVGRIIHISLTSRHNTDKIHPIYIRT